MSETRGNNHWRNWLASEEGKRCADWETLTAQNYLENRLWQAFTDGMRMQREEDEETG